MHDVAIIGAGELGGAIAHVVARRDLVRTIRLIDSSGQIAAGKALDIMQASPIESFSTQVTGTTDLSRAAGAAIVVVADQSGSGEWQGEEGLQLLRQLSGIARHSLVICAGASQRELVDRGAREVKWSRAKLLGSAPEALAAAVRAVVALEIDTSPRDVALTVLGVPPGGTVVPWDDATIGGFSAASVLDEPARRRIAGRVGPLWPPGAYALATAAAAALSCIVGRSRQTLSCFVAPAPTDSARTKTAALPVRLGPDGVVKIVMPSLSVNARVALDNAMML